MMCELSSCHAVRVPTGVGDLLGHIPLFVGGVRHAQVVATEYSVLATMTYTALLEFTAQSPELGLKVQYT